MHIDRYQKKSGEAFILEEIIPQAQTRFNTLYSG